MPLRLEDVRRAWEARDPDLVPLLESLANQPDPEPKTPPRDGALTFDKFLNELRGRTFRRKTKEEQAAYRIETLKALEAPTAEVPLPDRLRSHEIILQLWRDDTPFARLCLLRVIAGVPLVHGPWRALKRIFKEAEAKEDTEVLGALAARFDMARSRGNGQVSQLTLGYLCRRAWRYLRRLGQTLPACYADVAVDFLAPYTDETNWPLTWVANHIFYHESKQYTRSRFAYHVSSGGMLKHRAFPELWQRSPRPLFSLLERAQSDRVREFAVAALKTDFRALLREVEPHWVARLVNVRSAVIDNFAIWILSNVPRFEQGAFRTLGLHDAVLRLVDSPADEARVYAADYARTHARDLPVDDLIRLANNDHEAVRKLAFDLLQSRDARKDIGLEAWGRLLETEHGHDLAASVLRKHFGAKELTPEWFAERLRSPNEQAFEFARKHLPQVHPVQKLGAEFFRDLLDRLDEPSYSTEVAIAFALGELARFDLNTLDPEFLRRLFVNPFTSDAAGRWVDEGKLKAQSLPLDYWRTLAFHPDWERDPWITSLKASRFAWAKSLEFSEQLSERVLGWLRDVRRFSPAELGQDWLFQLVARGEPRYHDFAVELMTKAFTPADFAPVEPAQNSEITPAACPTTIDLAGATFLFTGKLATMQRKEAEDKVRQANGVNASSVNAKLHYLVIGDEGSPLYGAGKKGAKQVKAEEVNAGGGNIKIISETAFLQMLAGKQQSASGDAVLAGCRRLWDMLTAGGQANEALGRFALKYVRRHHPDICLQETDRPVDPGAEIPAAFLTFDLVKPLFGESRQHLRDFALELAKWEFARWSPPSSEIIRLCEGPYPAVRHFVAQALLADDAPEHRRYRIPTEQLSPAAVYSFCESPDETTRMLGMELIQRSPRLQLPEELFRLTESPDRKVRGFIIRALWSLYRDRGITADWKPALPPAPVMTSAAKKAEKQAEQRGTGAPARPEQLPANALGIAEFLRRILFELPPARLPVVHTEPGEEITVKLQPLPARKAKLSLVEMLRDLALEDEALASGVLPLFEEFMKSRGKSEHDACLVAVTRLRQRWSTRTE
ncbi:MAG: BRCT domain-containing protein [Planctomycetia bacterium]|nr:BRCT domain-containing protein [Planctomycetia bacterium]